MERYRARLLAVIRRRVDPALAVRIDPEEILHEAFLAACGKWESYCAQPTMSPYAWLYRIVVDCLIEVWRRESREIRDYRRDLPWPEQSSVHLGLHLVGSGTSPSNAVARKEIRQRIRASMDDMSPSDQEILWMRHHDQLSFKEAAMVLGISENAATVRYARALRRLKDRWSNDGDEHE